MSILIELKNLAYHEAGHVVVAWYYNIRITGVSISQQKDSVAHIIGHFGKIPVQAYQLERELDVAMAGAVAEEKVTGKKIKGWSGNDYINAVHMAAQWSELTGKSFDEAYLIDISIEVDQITGCLFSGDFLDAFAAHVRSFEGCSRRYCQIACLRRRSVHFTTCRQYHSEGWKNGLL